MWLDPGYREQENGFAMLIDVGTIALILSKRGRMQQYGWETVEGKLRGKVDMRGDYNRKGKRERMAGDERKEEVRKSQGGEC